MLDRSEVLARSKREDETYESGIKRGFINKLFEHSRFFFLKRRDEIIRDFFSSCEGKDCLELGSTRWIQWIDNNNITPRNLVSINISSTELEKGRKCAEQCRLNPIFQKMDAHFLEFPDNSFDMVFGSAILHHLNLETVLDEISRVLRPGGKIFFSEPLIVNPVGKVVRLLTPEARTIDERPLGPGELRLLTRSFNCNFYFEELLSVPVGIMSSLLFREPGNFLMKSVYELDQRLIRTIPSIGLLCRVVVICGYVTVDRGHPDLNSSS